jgi:hypothetical protein
MVKLSNGLGGAVYKDESEYKVIGGCVHRYSKTLDKWILCLDECVNKQIKLVESVK